MNDQLTISTIEAWTHIGVPDLERAQKQRLLVSITFTLDTQQAGKNDDVNASINYDRIVQDIEEICRTERKTIECFAEDTANTMLQTYNPIAVNVTVQKFALPNTGGISLSITRPC